MNAGDVRMRDEAAVRRKVAALSAAGHKALKVITDFDFTISKFWYDAAAKERACSCYKLVEDCGLLESHYHDKAQALQRRFYPVEVNPDVGREEKVAAMLQWVTEANELLRSSGFQKEMIPKMVAEGKLIVREGTHELCDLIAKHDVPLLIFSGGIANVVEAVLAREGIALTDSAHVVSNHISFDADGGIAEWSEPKFHSMNKHAATIQDEPFMQNNTHRRNVLLFGDSLGDIHMSDGLDVGTLLTVGFLNDNVESRLDDYLQAYDVVILGDPSLDYHLELLKKIVAGGLPNS